MISGASHFIGAAVRQGEMDLEELGYEFEKLILHLTSLGLSTCWLGGTFKRKDFLKVMNLEEGELFPAVSPFGYAAEKKTIKEGLARYFVKSDQRKPWSELFFSEDFSTPLSVEASGEYVAPLEMVRLAPSASNMQPWRILKSGSILYHFYEYKSPGYSDKFGYDIQRIDMGIAACHFALTAKENHLDGGIHVYDTPDIPTPENYIYRFSWACG